MLKYLLQNFNVNGSTGVFQEEAFYPEKLVSFKLKSILGNLRRLGFRDEYFSVVSSLCRNGVARVKI